jgi:hypothetical protein
VIVTYSWCYLRFQSVEIFEHCGVQFDKRRLWEIGVLKHVTIEVLGEYGERQKVLIGVPTECI